MPRCSRTMCSKAGWLLSKRYEWSHVWQQSEETLDGRPLPFPSMFAWKFFLYVQATHESVRFVLHLRHPIVRRPTSHEGSLRGQAARPTEASPAGKTTASVEVRATRAASVILASPLAIKHLPRLGLRGA